MDAPAHGGAGRVHFTVTRNGHELSLGRALPRRRRSPRGPSRARPGLPAHAPGGRARAAGDRSRSGSSIRAPGATGSSCSSSTRARSVPPPSRGSRRVRRGHGGRRRMAPTETSRLDLPVQGMTCASCASRIERNLNKLDGVEATVNFATERASVSYDPDAVAAGAATRRRRGRRIRGRAGAAPRRPSSAPSPPEDDPAERELRDLRTRLIVAGALSVPILADRDGARVPVRLLAVAEPAAGDSGRAVGRMAVPSRRLAEPAPRRKRRWTL